MREKTCGSITLTTSKEKRDERQVDCRVQCRNKFSGGLPEKLKLGIQPLLILNSRTSKFSREMNLGSHIHFQTRKKMSEAGSRLAACKVGQPLDPDTVL